MSKRRTAAVGRCGRPLRLSLRPPPRVHALSQRWRLRQRRRRPSVVLSPSTRPSPQDAQFNIREKNSRDARSHKKISMHVEQYARRGDDEGARRQKVATARSQLLPPLANMAADCSSSEAARARASERPAALEGSRRVTGFCVIDGGGGCVCTKGASGGDVVQTNKKKTTSKRSSASARLTAARTQTSDDTNERKARARVQPTSAAHASDKQQICALQLPQ